MGHDLWVTARCASDDLGIEGWPGEDGVFGALAYRAVRAFFERRRHEPMGSERIASLHEQPCFELHIDRDRGATWYDRENDVVFLLAVGWHETGSRDDFYSLVARLERSEQLYPTDEDYEELARWRDERDWTRIRHELGPDLFARARAAPGTAFSMDLGPCNVGVEAVDADGTVIGYRIVIWPSADRVHAQLAQHIADAVAHRERATPVLILTPEWGSYIFDLEASEVRD